MRNLVAASACSFHRDAMSGSSGESLVESYTRLIEDGTHDVTDLLLLGNRSTVGRRLGVEGRIQFVVALENARVKRKSQSPKYALECFGVRKINGVTGLDLRELA